MSKRVPGSMRTRQSLFDPIEGRLSLPDARTELVRLATRLIVEEALEAENRDALEVIRSLPVRSGTPAFVKMDGWNFEFGGRTRVALYN